MLDIKNLEERQWWVYHLKNPDNKETNYVGLTFCSPRKRFNSHLYSGKLNKARGPVGAVSFWINSLLRQGKKPIMEITQTGFGPRGFIAEIEEIIRCSYAGFPLKNAQLANFNRLQDKMPEEVIEKIRKSAKQVVRDRSWSQQQKQEQTIRLTGVPRSEECRKKLREVWNKKRPTAWKDSELLKRLYCIEKLSTAEIAPIIGASTPMVLKLLREFNIPRRRQPESLRFVYERRRSTRREK